MELLIVEISKYFIVIHWPWFGVYENSFDSPSSYPTDGMVELNDFQYPTKGKALCCYPLTLFEYSQYTPPPFRRRLHFSYAQGQ